jgi:RsiW-degrading membrane proteinase PrsW (M82 family)
MRTARWLVGLGLGTAVVLALTAAGTDARVFALAAAVATLPLPLYVGVVLWLDRFEPEPRHMLAIAFLWGASVAVVVSGLVNGLMEAVAGQGWTVMASAPLVEEALKAAILVRFYVARKDEFDGVVDGVIYAGMVGLGFAFAENVDYYGRALQQGGTGGLALLFTLRGMIAPFSHPLFTAMTGLGLGVARQSASRMSAVVASAAGFAGAVALHALWNAGASAGLFFFVIYATVMLPALGLLLAIVAVSLKFEGRVIQAQLAPEAAAGIITAADYASLCSVRGRLHASTAAFRQGGLAAWRAQRVVHKAASELAFLRRRAFVDGTVPDAALEAGYVTQLRTGSPNDAGTSAAASPKAGTPA